MLPGLAERFDVILFDNRGIGESDAPPGPYTVAEMAGDAVAVLDEAGVERAHVVGTSLGGMVAQELALAHPERVDRLVLACTTPGGPKAHPMPQATVALMAEAATLEPASRCGGSSRTRSRRRPSRAAGARRPDHGAPARDRAATGRLGGAGGRRRGVRRARPAGRDRRADARPDGAEDVVVDPRTATFSAAHPRRAPRALPGAGHLFFWEEPERSSPRSPRSWRRRVSGELTIGRWLADRARRDARPRRDPVPRRASSPTRELDRRAAGSPRGSRARGLRRGDRLATLTGTSPDHVATFFACAGSASRCSRSRGGSRRAEIAYQLDGRGAGAAPRLGRARGARDGRPAPRASRSRGSATRRSRPTARSRTSREDDDPLLLVYTSGTTGRPKGALLTHANCFWTNLSFDRTAGVRDDDVVLQVLPQFHVGGWNVQPLLAWWKGATVVLEPSFDARARAPADRRAARDDDDGRPATYLFLAQEPGFADADLSSLRLAVVGGAPMPEALLETWQRARGRDRPGVRAHRGGAERALPAAGGRAAEARLRRQAVPARRRRAPRPRDRRAARRAGDGRAASSAGRTSSPATGATRRPRRPRSRDGWLATGDVAERDAEGFYRIAGRIKDMVISGGENVYPAEIEDVLHAHPAVAEAAVVGVPDERWGEACAAFVVLARARRRPATSCATHCRERLARFKVPRTVAFVDALPRSAMGKVLKDELRAGARG